MKNISASTSQYQRKLNILHMDTSKEGDIFSIKFNREGTAIAMGLGEGEVQIYDLINKKHSHRTLVAPE